MADILSDNNTYSIKVAKFSGVDKLNLVKRNKYGYKCLIKEDYYNTLQSSSYNCDNKRCVLFNILSSFKKI